MADLSSIQSTEATRIVGSDATGVEQTPVSSKTNGQLDVYDGCNTSALDDVLALTTGAIEGKVGGSRLANRKYIEMQALTSNVKWGYNTSCNFDLFKNQFFSLPVGDVAIYFKVSTGTGSVSFSEKS
jgi:hypothetical protein